MTETKRKVHPKVKLGQRILKFTISHCGLPKGELIYTELFLFSVNLFKAELQVISI